LATYLFLGVEETSIPIKYAYGERTCQFRLRYIINILFYFVFMAFAFFKGEKIWGYSFSSGLDTIFKQIKIKPLSL